MADHHDHDHYREFEYERVTSPMQPFSTKKAAIGAVVAVVGILVAFVLPIVYPVLF